MQFDEPMKEDDKTSERDVDMDDNVDYGSMATTPRPKKNGMYTN